MEASAAFRFGRRASDLARGSYLLGLFQGSLTALATRSALTLFGS